jgi:hypothetical protein
VYGQSEPSKIYLLHVSKGQTFTDIGSDDKTAPVPVDSEDRSKGLKVVFFKGDSVGDKAPKVKNWKPFSAVHISVTNPSDKPVKLSLNVFHSGTRNSQTRVIKVLSVPPGESELATPLESLTNVNGSAPALGAIRKWYLADAEKAAPTLIFRDIWLTGDPSATGMLRYGADLSDPARLERIGAAKMPAIEHTVSFDTPEADAICSALEVFPPDNPWNTVIEDWPLHPNSKGMVASAGVDKPLRCNRDMAFILIPPNQPRVKVKLGAYAKESNRGPYPLPDDTPIEGWPLHYAGQTLDQAQRKIEESDRHAIVVDPGKRMLYEFSQIRKTDAGWTAAGAAIFDLKSNKLRPDGWTSTDAAGLPIFPAVVRYDEIQRGIVEHAMRFTVVRTRRAHVYPATHDASRHSDGNLPRMGERFRLRKDFDVTDFSPEVQAILKGLKKYGMYVADNGQDWALSVTPDPRIRDFAEDLRRITGADFEVVEAPPGYEKPD